MNARPRRPALAVNVAAYHAAAPPVTGDHGLVRGQWRRFRFSPFYASSSRDVPVQQKKKGGNSACR